MIVLDSIIRDVLGKCLICPLASSISLAQRQPPAVESADGLRRAASGRAEDDEGAAKETARATCSCGVDAAFASAG